MADLTPNYTPCSDTTISDEEIVSLHDTYIKQSKYEEAKTLIDNNTSMNNKGFRASLFNLIEKKIQELQIYLLNKVSAPDEYYSLTEPDADFMKNNNYKFWIKPL